MQFKYNAIEYNIVPLKELITGGVYRGLSIGTQKAYWDGERFLYFPYKCLDPYIETIEHPDNDNIFDVFLPFELVDDIDFANEINELR